MRSGSTRAVLPIVAAAAVAAALFAGCGGSSGSDANAVAFPGGDAVPARPAPPIRLVDYKGKQIDLSRLHRPVLVAFLYTHCHDLCPLVAGKVHTAFARLPRSRRPLFLAVSVDPAHDTPASAAAFNRQHRTSGEIDWLLGTRPELEAVWKAWHVKPQRAKGDPEEIEHSAEIFAIDSQGQIRALYPPAFRPARLAEGVEELDQL